MTGAGGGREVLGLLEQGYDAVGYEPNFALVQAGRRLLDGLGYPDRLHELADDCFPADERPDAVLVGWGSHMLVVGRARRVAYLRAARAALPRGAPILLSFWVREPVQRRLNVTAAVATVVRRIVRRPPADLGDDLAPNFVHQFTAEEISGELASAGFEPRMVALEPYGHAVGIAVDEAR